MFLPALAVLPGRETEVVVLALLPLLLVVQVPGERDDARFLMMFGERSGLMYVCRVRFWGWRWRWGRT